MYTAIINVLTQAYYMDPHSEFFTKSPDNSPEEINRLQRIEMEKYRWIRSEEAGRDLGPTMYLEWISKFAAAFREEYKRMKK